MPTAQEGGKVLGTESSEVLQADDTSPVPQSRPRTQGLIQTEESVHECCALKYYSAFQLPPKPLELHFERGHLMVPSFSGFLPFPVIFQDAQLYQVSALCLNKVTILSFDITVPLREFQ